MTVSPVPTPSTWTFFGHWADDKPVVEYAVPGEVDDPRIDTGFWEQGLWAASASGPTLEAAQASATEEYAPAHCTVCGTRVQRSDPADPESYVHADDGDWGDHTAEYTHPGS